MVDYKVEVEVSDLALLNDEDLRNKLAERIGELFKHWDEYMEACEKDE